ncbi:hypothetical protein NLJ89_g4282 [Agrocybe chaxingu]|uniref:F-box only protein 9 n=1 Tax=Agrocybe chaxingu TaxID=84603 RepID=A0A9W8MW35_9AGAR|nr:hypothetical protein NLJ89_g4282 [Agrocybe chaxingu]
MVASPPKAAAKLLEDEQEPAELVKFRQEWLAELQKRKAEQSSARRRSSATAITIQLEAASSSSNAHDLAKPQFYPPESPTSSRRTPTAPAFEVPSLPAKHPVLASGQITYQSPVLQNALSFYHRAIEHEQKGELDEALNLYRQAFRLDDNVDRAYRREQMLQSILNEHLAFKKALDTATERGEDLSASFESAVTITPPGKSTKITGTLANLIRDFPHNLKFLPENEEEPVFLDILPEELLIVIIGDLDATSVERFGSVSKKARMMTLDPGVWRHLVRVTYKHPQVPDQETMINVVERFLFDYRRVYIEQPRIRVDGVYIAICHYVRPGLSDNSWVNISHLITYHRYLRFFPNGQVLSLLANEENGPQQVIPLLKPTLRMKGLFIGHWKLIGTTVHLSSLFDASGRFSLPSLDGTDGTYSIITPVPVPDPPAMIAYSHGPGHGHTHGHNQSNSAQPDRARYVFDMTLNLRSKPLGRWNRMDILTYDSVHVESGDVQPVALKHERPFWFSKVRSYA